MTTHDEQLPPILTADTAVAALEAIGFNRNPDDDEHPLGFHLGALLALLEASFYQDLDRTGLPDVQTGYFSMLAVLCKNDMNIVAPMWAELTMSRLNRTAVELNETVEGSGRPIVDVAGPAMLLASNMMGLINRTPGELTVERVRDILDNADRNARGIRRNLGFLREQLRRDGFLR